MTDLLADHVVDAVAQDSFCLVVEAVGWDHAVVVDVVGRDLAVVAVVVGLDPCCCC